MKSSEEYSAAKDELVIPLAEEKARIEKRQGATRTVRKVRHTEVEVDDERNPDQPATRMNGTAP